MNFKLVLIAGALASVALVGAQAGKPGGPGRGPGGMQGGPGGPGGMRRMMTPEERLKRMTTDLNLTPVQQKKIKPLLEANSKKAKAIFENKKLSDTQKRDAVMKIRDDYRKQLAKILTKDQMKKMEAMRQRRGGPGGPGGGRGPGNPPTGLKPGQGKGGH